MHLGTAAAFSLLSGAERSRVAATLRRVSRESPGISDSMLVELVLAQLEREGRDLRPGLAPARAAAAAALRRAAGLGVAAIGWDDPRYPPALGSIADPPPVLWVRGRIDAFGPPAVAIVGSRAASAYACDVAATLGEQLAERGVAVVSGLARGADSAAHRGCLAAGGLTIAVLGSGPDVVYPAEHDALAAEVAERGLIVSELPPGTAPRKEHFPLRNRIISGISLAVVVVEASERSGSLITARCALEQGRDVMAVPGNALNGRNRGSHALLKDGAKVVECADDILQELGWGQFACRKPDSRDSPCDSVGRDFSPGVPGVPEPGNLLENEPLLRVMEPGEGYDLDELGRLCGRPGAALLPRLLELELAGRIARAGGGRFVRTRERMVT
jgi:DNA processing protein